MFSRVID